MTSPSVLSSNCSCVWLNKGNGHETKQQAGELHLQQRTVVCLGGALRADDTHQVGGEMCNDAASHQHQ